MSSLVVSVPGSGAGRRKEPESCLRTGGGFHLILNGPIYDESFPPNSPPVIKVVGHGKVTCEAYSPYVVAPFASGPYFEAVLGNTDGD